jgi:hypothetical protein
MFACLDQAFHRFLDERDARKLLVVPPATSTQRAYFPHLDAVSVWLDDTASLKPNPKDASSPITNIEAFAHWISRIHTDIISFERERTQKHPWTAVSPPLTDIHTFAADIPHILTLPISFDRKRKRGSTHRIAR